MNIDKIKVVDRHRRDLGDLTDLAASISLHGLMHPVVITDDGRLIAGERRLEACRSMGWTDIKVTFITDVGSAKSMLEMERDENECRKEMAPSEKIALGCALEELERPKAKAAQVEGQERGRAVQSGGLVSVPPNGNQKRKAYDVREDVAPAVGLSTASYSRAKQLVTAAEQGDTEAQIQVEEMDRTGKITKPYETWKGHKVNRGPEAPTTRDPFGLADEATPEAKKKSTVRNAKGKKPADAMENAVATLSGIAMPMRGITADDLRGVPDEARTRWIKELSEVLSTLRRVRDLIKEN